MDTSDLELLSSLASNLGLIDELYAQYQADPASVGPSWQRLFSEPDSGRPVSLSAAGPLEVRAGVKAEPAPAPSAAIPINDANARLLQRVYALVRAYRIRGHLEADLDPLRSQQPVPHPDLDPKSYGLTDAHMSQIIPDGGLYIADGGLFGMGAAPLGALIDKLRRAYCGHIGVEFMHISDPVRRSWVAERMETAPNRFTTDHDAQVHILERLVAAEALERFIHTKFVGNKRFSLEGGESLVPLLDLMLEQAGRYGVQEVVLGMAHRGRLNVLANLVGKRPSQIFAEFEDIDPQSVLGGGDVKYHMGYSTDHVTRAGDQIHLSLAFNPSHLEAVDPVAVGRVRAKQRRKKDRGREKVLGVLIHGDAAFAGQGLVAETLNLSNLHGYRTGGTLHIIVNNQIGFTTSPAASRSTPYCTDVAKMIQVPIFHVNGDDPEAVAHVVDLAMEYRYQFKCDVIVDMFCFRRYGHNESDEPSFTQPLLYQRIDKHQSVPTSYARSLIERGVLSQKDVEVIIHRRQAAMEADLEEARQQVQRPQVSAGRGVWEGFLGGLDRLVPDVDTGVSRERLQRLAEQIVQTPPGFTPHPKIVRLLQQRGAMGRGEAPLDWGMGEALAFGTLLEDGALVRVSGQDSRRGTFSHRHAVLSDIRDGKEYTPLQHLAPPPGGKLGEFHIYDSMLSEAAVLGFEYGYSLDYPDGLIVWEAQFGDFVNGAQVIIDQFLSSAEDKWKRLSGLVMLLPHGYEGQGAEHSSARLERFLQLCAEDNMQVVYPTTPAQLFHLLRRQVRRPLRKPLVVFSPKSLLRLPAAGSPLDELAIGQFQPVLPDLRPDIARDRAAIERVLLCTGKVYYDLLEEQKRRGEHKSAIVRLEQLYPLRREALQGALQLYPAATEVCWVQEEPANMGALSFVAPRIAGVLGQRRFRVVSRPESASPATGSHKAHVMEQQALLSEAFDGPVVPPLFTAPQPG